MNMMLNQLSEPQAEFFTSEAKSIAAVAGFGAGKTDIALHRLTSTMFEHRTANMLYLAPTFPLIKDIWYPKVEDYLTTLGVGFHINRGENTISVAGHGKIFCRTMEHPHRIIGFEVLDAFLDELDVLPEEKALEVWRKSKARCRQKIKGKRNQQCVTTTPEGFKATHKLFVKDKIPGSHLVQMSTYSNEVNLPDDYIDELRANYPPQLIEAYINGIFVNLVGSQVYRTFCRTQNNTNIQARPKEALHIGMDFNVGQMSAVAHVIRKGLPVAVNEITGALDTPDMIDKIQYKFGDRAMTIYPDASGKNRSTSNASTSDIKLLKSAGLHVLAKNVNPRVRNRINSMNAMFCNAKGQRRYYVNTKNCPEYTDCLEQQVMDANGTPDKSSGKDHLPDAGGYFIEHRFGIVKPSSQTGKLRT